MCREIKEELNCRVISWEPLGYQKNSVDGIHDGYQLRVYARLEKIGEFETQKAETFIFGRKWTAWFSPEIPIQDGPYKFRGLPGLIVKIR